ncbi:F-box protein MAX2 [Capsicum annuum]|uniref:F-box protein MAX2 n=1 Tax=Capsicum annuum TaxID=4072 RepID=A0A1U8HC06_CAPAN|nr:F-box/LRR-repeat MAX2 homolog A [Capsicum annuum]KAF3627678.1 F-box protein MAX2 [Capsicum annuum]KAF3685602.1 F-box protein MAX2 [Capsicum annuum]PHT63010.1 F-box protein MAX2 [Capsicum annuum]
MSTTTINDLPDVLLYAIISTISDVRSRNSTSLVSRKFRILERITRSSLTLRGNIGHLFMLPNCFQSITHVDLSFLSPWGGPYTGGADTSQIAQLLNHSFPSVTSLVVYGRDVLPRVWPGVKEIKLVRWHQRPQLSPGEELDILFQNYPRLVSIDLSTFYCWTEDIPAALECYPTTAASLTSFNLLNSCLPEGFKSEEVMAIARACPNLKEFRVACMFDCRYIGFVGDECLVCIANNCPKLSVLHLADTSALLNSRSDPNDEGFTQEDAKFSVSTLIEVFSGLPLLEELVLDVCNSVRDTGPALEVLSKKCPKLRSLKLGQFCGVSMPIEWKLDGVALCQGLQSLSLRNVGDLDDMGLIAIGRGCWRLAKFEIQGCNKITMSGMRTLVSLLKKTLVDVKISSCKNLGASSSLKALEPIQERIQKLHIDCVWDSVEEFEDLDGYRYRFDLNVSDVGEGSSSSAGSGDTFGCEEDVFMIKQQKRCKFSYDLNSLYEEVNGHANGYSGRSWDRLQSLSLWIGVGELLTPLTAAGLEDCPNLEEIKIRVEGDCRLWSKPSEREFGLSTLLHYPMLSKMHLDCGDTIGYAHTAPSGQMDLSLWERFYLFGIGNLSLTELDYWPPQDRDVNQRCLSLPAAGLLQECVTLRKLFIHGTAHEHFMMFLLRIPNLRDVQLREDYYPAPENDTSTEMRADSLSRFEAALNRRPISD